MTPAILFWSILTAIVLAVIAIDAVSRHRKSLRHAQVKTHRHHKPIIRMGSDRDIIYVPGDERADQDDN